MDDRALIPLLIGSDVNLFEEWVVPGAGAVGPLNIDLHNVCSIMSLNKPMGPDNLIVDMNRGVLAQVGRHQIAKADVITSEVLQGVVLGVPTVVLLEEIRSLNLTDIVVCFPAKVDVGIIASHNVAIIPVELDVEVAVLIGVA